MIKIIKVLFVFVPMHSIFASNIYEVPIKSIDYTIERVDGFERILISGSYSCTEPGYPELPAITYSYLLPQGQKLVQVDIVQVDWEEIPGNYYLYPKQRERAMIEEYELTEPNLFVYGSGGPYPEHIVVNNHSGNMRGYQIGQVGIAPFRYFPLSGRLQVLKHLVIKLETEQREIGLFPKRQTSLARDIVDRVISSLVVNSEALNEAHMRPASCIEENREDAAPTNLPSLLGAPVDLLVITTESQLDAYEDYARYKKSYGYNEVVKTLSWVREHYQGVDDAERLRNFIRDAHENWGVLYVLLGGDVPDVPSRWLLMAPMEWEKQPFPTVTDHYFSDLDSTWNKDGDHMFCELEDSLGLYPDVFCWSIAHNRYVSRQGV